MTRPLVTLHNIEIDEVITREMNDEEFAQYKAGVKAQAEQDAEQAAKEADKAALLAKLGITADEAKLLLA